MHWKATLVPTPLANLAVGEGFMHGGSKPVTRYHKKLLDPCRKQWVSYTVHTNNYQLKQILSHCRSNSE